MTNITADVMESIVAAIYIDGGIKNAEKFIQIYIIQSDKNNAIENINYKGVLIEKCHTLGYESPNFKFKNNNISNKQQLFKAYVNINNVIYNGSGKTKKNAEVNAAKEALKELG